ncbi:uncharacterized protein LOC117593980 [Esox lucius]|uniref:uncharacterized protein LOC117593980 n=1 Tax=Esox lucius TaxID=8010 RepID=UPI0014777004|nr:uncharacterized protein LOC117593980 [Esox lucius]
MALSICLCLCPQYGKVPQAAQSPGKVAFLLPGQTSACPSPDEALQATRTAVRATSRQDMPRLLCHPNHTPIVAFGATPVGVTILPPITDTSQKGGKLLREIAVSQHAIQRPGKVDFLLPGQTSACPPPEEPLQATLPAVKAIFRQDMPGLLLDPNHTPIVAFRASPVGVTILPPITDASQKGGKLLREIAVSQHPETNEPVAENEKQAIKKKISLRKR